MWGLRKETTTLPYIYIYIYIYVCVCVCVFYKNSLFVSKQQVERKIMIKIPELAEAHHNSVRVGQRFIKQTEYTISLLFHTIPEGNH